MLMCGREVRPHQIGGAHLNLDVQGACVRPKKRRNSHLGIFPKTNKVLFFRKIFSTSTGNDTADHKVATTK